MAIGKMQEEMVVTWAIMVAVEMLGGGNMLYIFGRCNQQLINLVSQSTNSEIFDMPATSPGMKIW